MVAIKALMVDVDGVLIDGRPEDGKHWQTFLEHDFGITPELLRQEFFEPYWEDIVLGRAALMDHLAPVLQRISPKVSADQFVSYWFEQDSRLVRPLLHALSLTRSAGIRVYLATNQEHLRATYIMEKLGLSKYFDGVFYSAQLGVRKPEPAFFTKVRSYVGLNADELLLVDDSQQNIHAAVKDGWNVIHWTNESSLKDLHAALGQGL